MYGPLLTLFGVYLLTRGVIFWGIVVIAIGLFKSTRTWLDPQRRVQLAIGRDAVRYGLRVPPDHNVRAGLEAIYVKFRKTTAAFPQLEPTYADLIDSMWQELRGTSSLNEWRRLVREVNHEWPTPWGEGERPIEASLKRAKHAASQWREAKREASELYT